MGRLLVFAISIFSLQALDGQEVLISYNENNPTARIIYEGAYKLKNSERSLVPNYPVEGNYSPTSYSNGPLGIDPNRGYCNYVYVPTESKLEPGKQYTLKLSIKFDESYDEMSFYQDNFGLALTSYLYPNKFPSHWGLWKHTNESLGVFRGGEIVDIEMEFRPLCTSKYVVLGVFRAGEMDHLSCFFCYYPFEIYELSISESTYPEKACSYFGDEYKQIPDFDTDRREYSVFFDSGSSELSTAQCEMMDSLAVRVKTSEDILLLSAHTDMSGNDNIRLGAARNEAVRNALIARSIDKSRIVNYNFADSRAADVILSSDRRVEINLVKGDLFRKQYSAALEAAHSKDYPRAHRIMMNEWLNTIPPKKALSAVYDCWGESPKALAFKQHLRKSIKSKFYGKNLLKFKLDSMRMEWLKGRNLSAHITLLRLPGSDHACKYETDNLRDSMLVSEADAIFKAKGFPNKEEVGRESAQIIPEIILTSDNIEFLESYLPLFRSACEVQKLKWENYARLYDKISIAKNGFQRYGTNMMRDDSGQLVPSFPFEDASLVDEYRRQVKLAPFSKSMLSEFSNSQESLDSELVTLLNNIFKADQHHRNRINERNRDFKKWAATDSVNQIKVKKILDERGWLGPDVVGQRGNTTLFLVIQHSDLKTQLKYLPMMRQAVKLGNAKGRDLAFLEDRVALGQAGKQIYGSQILKNSNTGKLYVAPIKNPENVNNRRAEVGLGPIEDYVKRWNIEWDVNKHLRVTGN